MEVLHGEEEGYHEQDGLLVGDDHLARDFRVGDGQLEGKPAFFYELQPLLCHAQSVWGLSFCCEGELGQGGQGAVEIVHGEDHSASALSFSDVCYHGSRGGGGDVWLNGERMDDQDLRKAGSMLDHFDTGFEEKLGCLSPTT